MGDNKCKNENDILRLAESVINDTITKDTNPIKDIFSYTFKKSYYKTSETYNLINSSIINSDKKSGSNFEIIVAICAFIVSAILYIIFLFYYFIQAIWYYLEYNLLYKIINIELFRTIDDHKQYYSKFILLSDGLIDLKSNDEGDIKNIIDYRIEKILQDRLNGYLKDIGKIDIEYREDRERKGREKKIDNENNQHLFQEGINTLTNGSANIIVVAIKTLPQFLYPVIIFFKNWSDTIAGFFIVTACIILIILFIFEIYAPPEIDKKISEKFNDKMKKYNDNNDYTLFASLSRIPLQFELLFDEIQVLYQSFVKRVVFFKDFSSEFISDARNYSSYPFELSREDADNGGIYDNIYTFDYNFIINNGIYNDDIKESQLQGKAILLIRPMELKDHVKEIYGQTANLSKLNTSLVLEQDGSNYKYTIKCTGADADKNIFSSNCTIADIEGICGPEKQKGEDGYSKIQ